MRTQTRCCILRPLMGMPDMTDVERLARAVLLFHRGGQWTGEMRNEWVMLTDSEDATTKALCDLARRLLRPECQVTPRPVD
jgi:hypothetical protein